MEDKETRNKASVLSNNAPAQVSESSKVFEIEISNPFFTGPSNINLVDLTAPKTQVANKNGQAAGGKDAKNNSA